MKRYVILSILAASCACAADDAAVLKQRIEVLEREVAALKEENKKLSESAVVLQHYDSMQDCLAKRGQPVVVANAFRFEKKDLPTISFYELDKTATFALFTKRDRYLVYTSDIRFAQHVGYHFKDMHDPTAWTGSTMFGAVWPTNLEIVHFDAAGKFIDARHYMVAIAYLEAGREGHLIRHPTQKKKEPNKAPEPTP